MLAACVVIADAQGEFVASAAKLSSLAHTDQRYGFKVLASLTNNGFLETVRAGNGRAPAKRKVVVKKLK